MPARSTFGSASVIPFSNAQTPYSIQRSLRFNSGDSAYLSRTAGTPTNNKKWTWSGWVKRSKLGTYQGIFDGYTNGNNWSSLKFWNDDRIIFYNIIGAVDTSVDTVGVFRDCSAWYHVVFAWDSDNATVADRCIIYVNGTRQTVTNTYGSITSGEGTYWNLSGVAQSLGRRTDAGYYLDGLLTEINFIDGQALTPSSFGYTDPITGVWMPKKYAGEYGTNGFYLNFSDNSNTTSGTLGKDYSGKGNDWTPSGFSVGNGPGCDSMLDVPTTWGTDVGAISGTVRGNYCTFNPLKTNSVFTLENGNLDFSATSSAVASFYLNASIGVSSGKWYWEVTPSNVGAGPNIAIGIRSSSDSSTSGSAGVFVSGYGYGAGGNKIDNSTSGAYGSSYTTSDIIGIALDMNAGTIVFYKNNTSQGTAFSGISGTFEPSIYLNVGGVSRTIAGSTNFGQRPFAYAPPSGFKSLCTTNLPAPVIKNPRAHFDAITYNGTGTTFVSPSALAFAPDLVWVKSRSQATSHIVSDTVRGIGEVLCTNNSRLSSSDSFITNFNQDGFTLNNSVSANNSGSTYVAWCWKAGGQTQTNTVGTIESQVNADPSRGFSVVSYTGTGANATVGHGLTTSPKFLIVKSRQTNGKSWNVWHTALAGTEYLLLEESGAKATDATKWNSTIPTASVFSLGTAAGTNTSAEKYIAYCWSEVEGYSKFGSYTGNNSTDGPFVWCGFRPRWILIKDSNHGGTWAIFDTARSSFNVGKSYLGANNSSAEDSSYDQIDILSNGFKLRAANATAAANNLSGNVYIFAAFSESPFNYARAR